jgi:AcrR family transcriptional regulator
MRFFAEPRIAQHPNHNEHTAHMTTTGARKPASRLPAKRRIADIKRAMREVLCEKGFEQTLISDVASRAGVVEGTIYRYFENKRDLLVKVVEDWYEEMLADFDIQLQGICGTWNRLRFMIWRHLKSLEQDPELCRLVFRHIRVHDDYRDSSIFDLNRRYTQRTLDVIREGIEAGEFREDVPLALVRDMIFGSMEHYAWNYLQGRGSLAVEDTADTITNMIHRGLRIESTAENNNAAEWLARVADRLDNAVGRLEESHE